MIFETKNAGILAVLLAKQKIAKPLKSRLLVIVKLRFEIVPVYFFHYSFLLLFKTLLDVLPLSSHPFTNRTFAS
jgi:hypothetical protein